MKGGHPFDPEGLVSSLTAVVVPLIGSHCASVAILLRNPFDRLIHWFALGSVGVILGISLDFCGIPLNTDLYSLSYLLLSTGVAIIALAIFYAIVDAGGSIFNRSLFVGERLEDGDLSGPPSTPSVTVPLVLRPFHWLGMNSILIYILSCSGITESVLSCVYWGERDHNLGELLFPTGRYWGPDTGGWVPTITNYDSVTSAKVICWCLFGYIPFWMALAGYLHRIRWYFKV